MTQAILARIQRGEKGSVRVSRTAQAEIDAFEIALTISEDSLDAALRFLDNFEATVGSWNASRCPALA